MKLGNRLGARTIQIVTLAVAFGCIVLFQNCSQPVAPSGVNPIQGVADKTQFMYDANLDQISYMSCPNYLKKDNPGGVDKSMFFSLRFGAHRTGGIKVKDVFFKDNAKRTPERMADILNLSKANSHTAMQVAIRKKGALNSIVTVTGTATKGNDYANLLTELGTTEMSSWMVNNGVDLTTNKITAKRTRYMRDGTLPGARMEGSIHFGESDGMVKSITEDKLSIDSYRLALTFVEPSEGGGRDYDVRAPYTVFPETYLTHDPGVAYGKAYTLLFTPPVGAKGHAVRNAMGVLESPWRADKQYPSNLLTSIQERDLSTDATNATPNGTWTCPVNMRFRVIRFEDVADVTANCRRMPDPDNLSADQAIVRNHLKHEDWFIDWERGCMIPKKPGSCYGANSHIQYGYTSDDGCDRDADATSDASNKPGTMTCMAWTSVCYRTTN